MYAVFLLNRSKLYSCKRHASENLPQRLLSLSHAQEETILGSSLFVPISYMAGSAFWKQLYLISFKYIFTIYFRY